MRYWLLAIAIIFALASIRCAPTVEIEPCGYETRNREIKLSPNYGYFIVTAHGPWAIILTHDGCGWTASEGLRTWIANLSGAEPRIDVADESGSSLASLHDGQALDAVYEDGLWRSNNVCAVSVSEPLECLAP